MNLQRTLLFVATLLAAAATCSAAPNSAVPKSFSQSPYRHALVDDLRAQILDVYEASTPPDAPHREVSLDMLDAAILWMADAPNKRNLSPLTLRARELYVSDETDALTCWLFGYMLHEHRAYKLSSDPQLKVLDTLIAKKSPYPFITKARFVSVLGDTMMLTERPEPGELAWNFTLKFLRQSLHRGEFDNIDDRVALWRIKSLIYESATIEYFDALKEIVESHFQGEWLKQMLLGEIEFARAWKIRTHAHAEFVEPEAWEPFHRTAHKASLHFQAAYAAAPDRPEAPAMLINTSKLGFTPFGAGPRYWFDIAVRDEFDYMPAYRAYLNSIVPRWGGSIAALDAFAAECMATDRYDTPVPSMAFEAWMQIWHETDHDPTIWSEPERYEQAMTMFDNYIRRGHPNQLQTRFTQKLYVARIMEDRATFDSLYEMYGDSRDEIVMDAFELKAVGEASVLHPFASKKPANPPE